MDNSEDEDRVLLSREYEKHVQGITKSKMREKHFKYKNIGYTEALTTYEKDMDVLAVLLGYIESSEIDMEAFIDLISKEMVKAKINCLKLTEHIINNRIKNMDGIRDAIKILKQ